MPRGTPKNFAEDRRKLEEKMTKLLARQREQEAKLQEANRRQIIRFVESLGADELEPHLFVGIVLEGMEKAKSPIHAATFRRKGEEHLAARSAARAAKPAQEPQGDGAGAGEGSASSEPNHVSEAA